jgi:hypothetical protein
VRVRVLFMKSVISLRNEIPESQITVYWEGEVMPFYTPLNLRMNIENEMIK